MGHLTSLHGTGLKWAPAIVQETRAGQQTLGDNLPLELAQPLPFSSISGLLTSQAQPSASASHPPSLYLITPNASPLNPPVISLLLMA